MPIEKLFVIQEGAAIVELELVTFEERVLHRSLLKARSAYVDIFHIVYDWKLRIVFDG
jgi:hypothetical protein